MSETMTSHELARLLLTLPDLPVATVVNNHVYASGADRLSHGPLKIGILEHYAGKHIGIGNIGRRMINPPNWWISEMLFGEAPNQWPTFDGNDWHSSDSYGGPTKNADPTQHFQGQLVTPP